MQGQFKVQNQIFGGKFRTNLRTSYDTIDYVSTSFSLVQRMYFLFPILFFLKKKKLQKQHYILSIY